MVKKDDEMSVSSETKGPLKSFQALMGEGEKFSRDKLYAKAIQSYTEALSLLPDDEDKSTAKDMNDRLNGLVARAACYLKIGKNNLALQDAEESLKSNKEFTRGLYQKAEALYAMGEFELALMFYHRGKKLRSDLREFQLGINKAQEAIDNSVGDPNRVKLEASGDLSIFYKNDEDEAKKKKKAPVGYIRASQKKDMTVQRKQHAPNANPKTTKQLLGDLYEDRAFLEKIINNTTVTKANTKSGDAIYQLASDGIDYLDSRTHFWRQQEPLYARSKSHKKAESDDETYKHVQRELETIDEFQNMDQFSDARRRAHRLLDFCDRLDEQKFPEKQPVLSDVYSRLGNANLELGDYNKALEYHYRDYRIAESKQLPERSSRALDNLGRVYARSGQFAQAIQVWERKIPLANSPLEKAWLFHEIGQCHYGLGDYERSKRYGERSYTAAVEVNDPVWQLNAKVLVAHSETKLRRYREAEQTFEEALTLAKDQHDMAAERAIERALKDVRDQIAKGAADSPPDRPEINYEIKVKSNENIVYEDDDQGTIRLSVYGDNGSSGPIYLTTDDHDKNKYDGRSTTLKKKAFDAGKMTKLVLTCNKIESWALDSIEITDTKRKTKLKFLLPQPLDSMTSVADLFPEGSIVDFSSGKDDKNKSLQNKRPTKTKKEAAKPPSADTNKKIQYTITVKTGSVLSAGTDANVYISLNGDKNKIARQQLQKPQAGGNPFERNSKDDFIIDGLDVGQLKTIGIEHDGTGFGSGWFLDWIEIKYNSNTVKFPIERWLDVNEGDKRTSLELEPNKKPAAKITTDDSKNTAEYEVTVKTADKRSAGTDANVYLSIFGDKDKFERRQLKESLDHSKNKFESGATNRFQIYAPDVGKIKTIRIEHDGSGIGAGWYVDSIEVRHVSLGETYKFPVDRWLDSGEGDKRTSLDLERDKKPGQLKESKPVAAAPPPPPPEQPSQTVKETETNKNPPKKDTPVEQKPVQTASDPNKKTQYTITVKTGSALGAGTDARVYLTLNGDKDKIVRRQLDKAEVGWDSFERNAKDVFTIDGIDVGQLKTIIIEHDGTSLGAGWFLDWLEIKYNSNTVKFPVGRWLDIGEGDKRISLELEPNKKPAAKITTDNSKTENAVEYEVTVKTANKKSAGTDANVYFSVHGDKGKVERHHLKESLDKSKNLFESGATNRFQIYAPDVGKIKTIRIEHDGSGVGAGWYVDSVEVRHISLGETYKFPVDRWLDSGEGDKRISLELEPDKKPGQLKESKPVAAAVSPPPEQPSQTVKETGTNKNPPKPDEQKPAKKDPPAEQKPAQTASDPNKKTQYTITVKTGSALGAGTDARVYLTLNGDKDKIVRRQLDKAEVGWDSFERNAKDVFTIDGIDVGQLKTIIIEHDGTSLGAGWFLDWLEIKYNSNTVKFPVGRWLDIGEGDKRISLELEPNKKPAAKITTDNSKTENAVEYEVTVKTANKRSAGTDANVYFSVHGDKGKVERHHLKESLDKSKNLFESGATNRFQIYAPDVGKIKTIRIEHDGSGVGAGWYVDSVEVRHISLGETYKFPVDRWLDSGEGDKRISLELEPDKKPGQLKDRP